MQPSLLPVRQRQEMHRSIIACCSRCASFRNFSSSGAIELGTGHLFLHSGEVFPKPSSCVLKVLLGQVHLKRLDGDTLFQGFFSFLFYTSFSLRFLSQSLTRGCSSSSFFPVPHIHLPPRSSVTPPWGLATLQVRSGGPLPGKKDSGFP